MDTMTAIGLGALQGVTEFLPISSSAHLVIVPHYFDLPSPSLLFDTTVHLATLISVLVYFRVEVMRLIGGTVSLIATRRAESTDARLALAVIVGTVPAVLAGYLGGDALEAMFSEPKIAAGFLLVTSGLMVVAEEVVRRRPRADAVRTPTVSTGAVVGLFQAFALIPGISRSGSTISGGMFLGLDRESAARFSFVLGIPALLGAFILQVLDGGGGGEGAVAIVTGFAAALGCGYLAIHVLLSYVRRRTLHAFAAYTAVFGVTTLVVL